MLNKLNEAAVDPDDLPLQPVLVTACGLCDSEVTSSPSPDSHSFPAGAVRTSLMRILPHHELILAVMAERRWISIVELGVAQGIHESLDESAKREVLRRETTEQAAARLRAESKNVRESVE